MTDLLKLRLAKLWVALTHPDCWRALSAGVAPAVEHRNVLRAMSVDGIIDVGANRGQFTLACRLTMPGIPIVAFEPIPTEAKIFARVHAGQPSIHLVQSALGNTTGTATLHLSNRADSSSLLPIGKKQTELFDGTGEVGTLTVPLRRLDELSEYWTGRSRQLLKLDVQGYELNVLQGAVQTLKSCAFVYAECSEVPLYDGQALRPEVEAFLQAHGFRLQSRSNDQTDQGKLIQADYLFARGDPRKIKDAADT
jgi:FkbM family methyltransferase